MRLPGRNYDGGVPSAREISQQAKTLIPYLGVAALEAGNLAPYESQEAKTTIEDTLEGLFPEDRWQRHGFNVLTELAKRKRPFIEIGGPSPRGYALVDLAAVKRATGQQILVTNISIGDLQAEVPEEMGGAIQIGGFVDARQLPYAQHSIGAFFTNGLGFYNTPHLFEQAPDVLEKKGLVIAGFLSGLEVGHALNRGLELKSYSSVINHWSDGYASRVWQTIFQKPGA